MLGSMLVRAAAMVVQHKAAHTVQAMPAHLGRGALHAPKTCTDVRACPVVRVYAHMSSKLTSFGSCRRGWPC